MNVAQIYIVGQIGNFGDQVGVQLEDVITQVNANKQADKYLVKIKSPGGDYDLGFDIHNYLNSLGKPVDTMAIGDVASISSVIFMAGENRIMSPGSSITIHNPWTNPSGAFSADKLASLANIMKDAEQDMLSFYAKTTNNTKEAIKPLMRVETVLNPERSKALGFATEVMVEMPMALAYRKIKNEKMSDKNSKKTILAKLLDVLTDDKPEIKALVVNVAQGQLDFFELPDDQEMIPLGAKATFGGEPAQGDYSQESGRTFNFESGVLLEITEAEPEVIIDEPQALDIEALTNDILTRLESSMEEKFNTFALKQNDIDEKLKENQQIFASLKSIIGNEVKLDAQNPQRKKEKQNQEPEIKASLLGGAMKNYNKN